MQPTRVLPAVSVVTLIGVEYGGWALLGFLTGRGQLGQFREQFFRAGHAHAGVLLILSLVYYLHLERTGYSDGVKWLAGSLLQAGILAQSGGFFVHLGLGHPNRSSLQLFSKRVNPSEKGALSIQSVDRKSTRLNSSH